MGDFAAKIANLEGKLLRSLFALVFQPGRLGAEWLAEKRIRWATPMGLFLLINVVYFLAPPISDFSLPLADHLQGQGHSRWALSVVDRQVPGVAEWVESNWQGERPKAYNAYATKFNQSTQTHSKLLFIAQVPLVALALLLLHWRRRIPFVDHFALALHYWAFILLSVILINGVGIVAGGWLVKAGWFSTESEASIVFPWTFLVMIILHLVLMLRRAYGQRWPMAALKAIPVLAACLVSHFVFRGLLFAFTYYSI